MFILETFSAYTKRETGDAFLPTVLRIALSTRRSPCLIIVSNGSVVLKRVGRAVLTLEIHGHERVGDRVMYHLSS